MKKLIDIPDEIVIDLKILAAKENKSLKSYIQDILIALANEAKQHSADEAKAMQPNPRGRQVVVTLSEEDIRKIIMLA